MKLTRRQQQIYDLVIQGLGNKEIGLKLGISHRTVEDHRHDIYRLLNVRNATQLVFKHFSEAV